MQVCHVNLASGYHGGENQTLQLIKQQLALNYQLTVVANPKSPFARAAADLGCKLVLASHFIKQHSPSITKECQLIHVHEGRALYWAMLQKKLTGCPYIVTRRIDNPLKNRWLLKRGYRGAAALVGLSHEIADRIKHRLPELTPKVIPSSPVSYPVTAQRVSQLKTRFAGKFLIIQAANMVKHKGFDTSISAARRLEKSHPMLHFALLGDGKKRQQLEYQAEGLTNLSFEGKQSNMGDWFAAADLMIHPAYSEGLGSVILEGIQAGLTVIASDVGGIPDIIQHQVNGLLIPPGDDNALGNAIIRLYQDPALSRELNNAARASLEKFDITVTAQQYEAIYQKVFAKSSVD